MTFPPWLVGLAHLALVLSLVVIVIVSPLLVFFTPGFVRYEYARRGFPPSTRFAHEERLRISDAIMAYLRGERTRDELAAVRTDGGEIALREREVDHLVDVKRVLDRFFLAYAISWILGALCLAALWFSPHRAGVYRCLRQSAWVIVGLMGLILVSSLIDFDTFFTRFHQMFFSANSWTFYIEDTLIQLYPLVFWMDTVKKLVVTILVETGILYGLSVALHRATRSR